MSIPVTRWASAHSPACERMVVSTVATSRCTIGHAATVAPDPSVAIGKAATAAIATASIEACTGELQERTFRCQAKPLSRGLVEAEENEEDPSDEFQHRWLRSSSPRVKAVPRDCIRPPDSSNTSPPTT